MNFGSNNLIKISTEKDAFERLFFMPPDCCKSDEKGQMAVIRALGYKRGRRAPYMSILSKCGKDIPLFTEDKAV